MELQEFINDLEKQNFYLIVEEGKLVLKADKKKLTAEATDSIRKNEKVISYIRQNKDRLIEHISFSKEKTVRRRSDNIDSIYRLSSLQEGILFHGLYDNKGGAYMQQISCELVNLKPSAFRQGWDHVMRNHSILRSGFYYDSFKIPVQCVYREVSMPVNNVDLRGISDEEQLLRIKEYEEADRSNGFNFKEAPLMRIGLLRLTDDRYRMVWTYHHLLIDGWSMPLLVGEFLQAYDAFVLGKPLPKLDEDRYEDYIRYIEHRDKEQEEFFWRGYLQGLNEPALLPFINSSARTMGVAAFSQETLVLNGELTAAMETFAQQHRITVNTVMQGVWALLLHRYTGSENISYGVTVSGRPEDLAGMERRVGLYINALPLHSNLKDEKNVVEWLQKIQEDQLQSRQYQYTSLADIQRWIDVQGDLFDSMMSFQNFPVSEVISAHRWQLQVENMQVHEQTSNYPLSIRVISGRETNIQFIYKSALLSESLIHGVSKQFEQVLRQLVSRAHESVRDLEWTTNADQQQLVSFNATSFDYPRDKSIMQVFAERVAATPDAIALAAGEEQLTYSELSERAGRVAAGLIARGIQPGDRIGLLSYRGTDMIVA
ncbi:MAG: condensation domain-containing protein, partial [Chitinophagaceae bacterium]